MLKKLLYVLLFSLVTQNSFAQDDYSDDYLEENDVEDSAYFFIGVNINAHFANKNTAFVYNGSPNVTQFGIPFIFNLQTNQQFFRDFFQHPFQIEEYPFEPRYRTAVEFGLNLGYQFNRNIALFADVNTISLKYEQLFTVAVDDPNNGFVGPTLLNFPIFGRESRFNLNLGAEFSLSNTENSNLYFPIYGNLNAVQTETNYILVNNRRFDILQSDPNSTNGKLGGVAFGGGTGLGLKFNVTEEIFADISYNIIYSKTNMTENVQPYGTHHTIGIAVAWRK